MNEHVDGGSKHGRCKEEYIDICRSSGIRSRIRRFKGTDIPQKIFDNIVLQSIEKGLVGGKILYSDSTYIKANANKRKFEKVEVDVTPKEYIEQLDIDVNEDRENHNKKPLKPIKFKKETKEIKKSTTS